MSLNQTQIEAIETADAYLNNAVLPTYAELLNSLETMLKAFNVYAPATDGASYNCVAQANALIAQAKGHA